MTNLEAVKADISPYTVDSSAIEKVLIDLDITSGTVYTNSLKSDIAKASVKVLTGLLALASESEGGFSTSFNIEGLRTKIASIAKENGIDIPTVATNIIRDASNYW